MQNLIRKSAECEGVQFDGNNVDEISQFVFGKTTEQMGTDWIWAKAFLENSIVIGISDPNSDLDDYYAADWTIRKSDWLMREKGKKYIYICDNDRFLREYIN